MQLAACRQAVRHKRPLYEYIVYLNHWKERLFVNARHPTYAQPDTTQSAAQPFEGWTALYKTGGSGFDRNRGRRRGRGQQAVAQVLQIGGYTEDRTGIDKTLGKDPANGLVYLAQGRHEQGDQGDDDPGYQHADGRFFLKGDVGFHGTYIYYNRVSLQHTGIRSNATLPQGIVFLRLQKGFCHSGKLMGRNGKLIGKSGKFLAETANTLARTEDF